MILYICTLLYIKKRLSYIVPSETLNKLVIYIEKMFDFSKSSVAKMQLIVSEKGVNPDDQPCKEKYNCRSHAL